MQRIVFLRKGQKFKNNTSFLSLNLFNGQTTLNLVRDNKHGRIRKPRARTRPTLCMSVIKLVPSPPEHSPFLDMTISTMQKMTNTKDLHVKVQLNKVLKNTLIVSE